MNEATLEKLNNTFGHRISIFTNSFPISLFRIDWTTVSTSGSSGIKTSRQTVLISCPYKPVLRVYNTATRKVEDFKSIQENKVGMYVCGLTVYNDMHLGHARTYIAFDVIRSCLLYTSPSPRDS